MQLTPLERDLFDRFHSRFSAAGFPAADAIVVVDRKQGTAGRHLEVSSNATINLGDGPVGIGTYSHLEMEGLPDGMVVLAYIETSRLVELELTVVGEASWDGVERDWQLITE